MVEVVDSAMACCCLTGRGGKGGKGGPGCSLEKGMSVREAMNQNKVQALSTGPDHRPAHSRQRASECTWSYVCECVEVEVEVLNLLVPRRG
jgi:hypothetical protein